ncbi:MAG TPA: hypothetical protein EYG89_06055 [Bacteroidia bacterium]|nr:hypothetical protein [Bacteroidia bacterium]
MNYLITIAVQFFRWALAWVARELVLLIVLALISNFFAEFRQLFLTFLNLIKDKIIAISTEIKDLRNQLEKKILKLIQDINRLSNKFKNFNIFLVEKSEKIKILLFEILLNKTDRIKGLIDTKVLKNLNEIEKEINSLSISKTDKNRILRKINSAKKGAGKVLNTTEDLKNKINATADKQLTQITNKIPKIKNIETTELTTKMQELTKIISESSELMNEEINLIFSKFTEDQVRDILEAQILNADDEIFDTASDAVSEQVKEKIKTPDAKKIKWLKLDHNKNANGEHAKNFKLNDIYRILVENFDRDERIALALRFAKKDHFRLRK